MVENGKRLAFAFHPARSILSSPRKVRLKIRLRGTEVEKIFRSLVVTLLTAPFVCVVFVATFFLTGVSGPFPTLLAACTTILCIAASVWVWRRAITIPATKAVPRAFLRVASVCLTTFGISVTFCNWLLFWMPTVQSIPMKSGYFLTIYQDLDVGGEELYYSLQGPRASVQKSFFAFVAGEQHPVPHFTKHATVDGRTEWVTADTKPDQIVFLLDPSNGLHWPDNHQRQLRWPEDKGYLDRINADGGHRCFYEGGYRLDQPNAGG